MNGHLLAKQIKERRAALADALGLYQLLRRSLGDVNRMKSPMRRLFQAGHLGALGRMRARVLNLMLAQRIDLINYQQLKGGCK